MNRPGRFMIPERLETERLLLRMFVDGDWRALHEHFSDAECTRFTFRRALTAAATWRATPQSGASPPAASATWKIRCWRA